MGRAKFQHFTPRLHLRKFLGTSPRGMLWEYDKERGSATPKAPEATGGQRYLYSVRDDAGALDHSVDDLLTDIENKAMAGYEMLLAGDFPQDQARADFSAFLATMYLRAPGVLRSMAETYGKILQIDVGVRWSSRDLFEKSLDEMDAQTGQVTVKRDELWDFWQDKDGFSIGTSIQHGLIGLGAADTIAPILFDREWYLLRAVEGYFITSDQAVAKWAPMIDPLRGDGGFANPAAEITMPLSPDLMLMITGNKAPALRLPAFSEQIEAANSLRARDAERFIWAHRQDEAVLALAKQFQDSSQGMHVGWSEPMADVVVERSLRRPPPRKR